MNNRNRRSPFNPNSFRDTSVVRRHGDSSSRLPVLNKPGGKSSTGPLSSRDLSYSRYFSQGSENDETRRSVERESIPRTYAADDDLPLDAFGELYSFSLSIRELIRRPFIETENCWLN